MDITADIEKIKLLIREKDFPLFTDDEIEQYYNLYDKDINKTCYELLIIKSQDTTLAISGLTTNDQSKFFLRLASRLATNNGGVL